MRKCKCGCGCLLPDNQHFVKGHHTRGFTGHHHTEDTKDIISFHSTGPNNPMFGKENKWGHHTEDAKETIRQAHLGKTQSLAHRTIHSDTKKKMFKEGKLKIWSKGTKIDLNKYPNWGMTNKKHTPEARQKMLGNKGRTGQKLTLYHCIKISVAQTGRKKSLKVRMAMSKAKKGKPTSRSGKRWFVEDLGHLVRSSWEENVCRILKYLKVEYEYEMYQYLEESKEGRMCYLPDLHILQFFSDKVGLRKLLKYFGLGLGDIEDYNLFIEIKGYLREGEMEKMGKFRHSLPGIKLLLLEGEVYEQLLTDFRGVVSGV